MPIRFHVLNLCLPSCFLIYLARISNQNKQEKRKLPMFFTLLAFLASVSTAGGDFTPLPSSRPHTCTSRKNALLPLPSSVHPAANFEPFDSALLEKAKSDVSVNRACREGFSHSTYEYIVEHVSSEGHSSGYPLSWFCEEVRERVLGLRRNNLRAT